MHATQGHRTNRSRRTIAAAASALMLAATLATPAIAQTEAQDDGPIETVIDRHAAGADLVAVTGIERTEAIAGYVDRMTAQGLLIDAAAVTVRELPGVGTLVGPDGLAGVVSFGSTVVETRQGGELLQRDEGFRLETAIGAGLEVDTPGSFGPGSALARTNYQNRQCFESHGSYDYDNYILWCYDKDFMDGGNGRRSYGSSDDDGSTTRDYYVYERRMSVTPSNTGSDHIITDAYIDSKPSSYTKNNKDPRTSDWSPFNTKCDGGEFVIDAKVFKFPLSKCFGAGSHEPKPRSDGGMTLDWSCQGYCPGSTIGLEFEIVMNLKQGQVPYWNDVSYASFRQQFTNRTDSARG